MKDNDNVSKYTLEEKASRRNLAIFAILFLLTLGLVCKYVSSDDFYSWLGFSEFWKKCSSFLLILVCGWGGFACVIGLYSYANSLFKDWGMRKDKAEVTTFWLVLVPILIFLFWSFYLD